MSLRRHAGTDPQERALANLETVCKALGLDVAYARHVGKRPHTVLLENRSAERNGLHFPILFRVSADGDVKTEIDGPRFPLGDAKLEPGDLEGFASLLANHLGDECPGTLDTDTDLTPAEA